MKSYNVELGITERTFEMNVVPSFILFYLLDVAFGFPTMAANVVGFVPTMDSAGYAVWG